MNFYFDEFGARRDMNNATKISIEYCAVGKFIRKIMTTFSVKQFGWKDQLNVKLEQL